jgi:hypothetical protein
MQPALRRRRDIRCGLPGVSLVTVHSIQTWFQPGYTLGYRLVLKGCFSAVVEAPKI